MKRFRGGTIAPLATLTAIAFFDEFDSAAFNVLTPEIRRAFDLTTAEIGGIIALNIVMTTAFVVPIGYIADRVSRKWFVVVSGIAAAVTSFTTGLAGAVWFLVLMRFGNGVGRLVNNPVHTSLISDYYAADERPAAISVHRASEPLGAIVGPLLVGGVVAALGVWRWAFWLLAIPAALAALVASRLREPLRGGTEDRASAEEAVKEEPIPFSRAFRMLYHVRTLRRIWLANFFGGAALFPLLPVFALLWDEEFGIGTSGRSFIASGGAAATLVGVLAAAPLTARLLRRGPHLVQLVAGLALACNAALLLVVAISPNVWVAVGAFCLIQFGFGIFNPTALTVASIVIPPRIRSQGFAYTPLFLTLGAILAFPLGGVADEFGYRWALTTFAPIVVFAGLVFASAARFVKPDWDRAVKTLETEAKLREERLTKGARSLLVCRGLDVSYDLVQVLYDVNVEVKEGEIVALLGTNGAGKSTLLKTVAGLMHPDAGVVYFDGRNITFHEPEDVAAEGVALSPGGQALFPNVTVRETLLAAAWTARRSPGDVEARMRDALELFPRLGERAGHRAGTLSGGEQQMLALAQVLVAKPKLLMIDELTLGLAPKIVDELLDAVRAIHARGVTIVLVEQSVNIAATIAHRCYFLERGQIRFEGPVSELLSRTDLLRSVFLKPATT